MFWRQQIAFASLSDVGFRRANNQDSYAYKVCSEEAAWTERGHLFLVADGMGGHAVGELASKIAADTIPHAYYKSDADKSVSRAIKHSLEEANRAIHERSTHNREFDRMGTTGTALTLSPQGAIIGHVGDSRAYRIRDGVIDQLTFDHSLQWELIRQGIAKPEDVHLHHPKNVITRCLGPEGSVEVDVEGPHEVFPGDRYLLCSDGLTGHLEDDEIGKIVASLEPTEAARLLIQLANLRGGSDNTTVLVVSVGDAPQGATPLPIPQQPKPEAGSSAKLGAMWGIAGAFAGGTALLILGMANPDLKPAGWALCGMALVGLIAFLVYSWRDRKTGGDAAVSGAHQVGSQGPYKTASAKLTRSFLNRLAGLVSELQRTADEENWTVDSDRMQQLSEKAGVAVAAKRATQALSHYAEAIDHYMHAIQEQRRLRNNEDPRG